MRMLRDERGNVLVLAALSMTMLMSFMAFGIDVGYLYNTQRQLQTLADAAAMAGALEIPDCGGTAKCSAMTAAANYAFTTENSAPAAATLTINNGPSALGSTANDPNYGDIHYVEAVVTENVPTFFARVFGVNTVTISARAEAGKSSAATPCADVIGPAGQTVTLNSGANITDAAGSTCGLNDNWRHPAQPGQL